jgi:hypothetical protein
VPHRLHDVLPRLAAARPAEAAAFRTWLTSRVNAELAPRRGLVEPVRAEQHALLSPVDRLDDALAAARNRLDPGPFRAGMTVHAAHARHPGVRAAFAARGLPACPDCPVGADETLAEAAAAEGFPLPELLAELAGLEA